MANPASPRHAKVTILGSSPAGYTAGIYTARALLKPLLIEGLQPGGQMSTTTDVENYPGFADVIQGPWLMDQMRAQAQHVGTDIVNDTIMQVDLKRQPFWLKGDSGNEYTADSVIIATGAQARWLGLLFTSVSLPSADARTLVLSSLSSRLAGTIEPAVQPALNSSAAIFASLFAQALLFRVVRWQHAQAL